MMLHEIPCRPPCQRSHPVPPARDPTPSPLPEIPSRPPHANRMVPNYDIFSETVRTDATGSRIRIPEVQAKWIPEVQATKMFLLTDEENGSLQGGMCQRARKRPGRMVRGAALCSQVRTLWSLIWVTCTRARTHMRAHSFAFAHAHVVCR